MAVLTAEQLLSLADAEHIRETVPLVGIGEVVVRAISLAEHREIQRAAIETGEWDWERWETLLLQYGLVEPALTYDQAAALRRKGAAVVQPLLDTITRLSGLVRFEEEVDRAEESFRQ